MRDLLEACANDHTMTPHQRLRASALAAISDAMDDDNERARVPSAPLYVFGNGVVSTESSSSTNHTTCPWCKTTGWAATQPASGFVFTGSASLSGGASVKPAWSTSSRPSSTRSIGWSGTTLDGCQSNWTCSYCFLSNVESATSCLGCKNSKCVGE